MGMEGGWEEESREGETSNVVWDMHIYQINGRKQCTINTDLNQICLTLQINLTPMEKNTTRHKREKSYTDRVKAILLNIKDKLLLLDSGMVEKKVDYRERE